MSTLFPKYHGNTMETIPEYDTGDTPWLWTDEQQKAFDALINAITTHPVLALPKPKGQFRIEADASDYAIGTIVSQLQDDKWHPIAYLSKTFTETQRNYEIYDKDRKSTRLNSSHRTISYAVF